VRKQQAQWIGEFGDEYLKRNRVDWQSRIPFWKAMMKETGARSVSEFGCNAGWNLSAILRSHPDINVRGHEINSQAIFQAKISGLNVFDYTKSNPIIHVPAGDLVFTSGVLIHIPPAELKEIMQSIIDASFDYVLAIEYESESGEEEEITYRGNSDMLWRRDYGKLYEDMGLHLVFKESVSRSDGFDDCTVWLFRK